MTRLRTACLVVLVLLGACSSSAAAHRSADTQLPSSTTLTPAPATTLDITTTTVGRPQPRPIVLAFAGDVHFEGVLRARLAADPAGALAPIAPLLASADVAMVNLETSITSRGTPQVKAFTFRAPASAFTALRGAGIDVVTMANNHGLDFGPVGFFDTLVAIKASGFPVVGIGADAAHAYAPYRRTVNGERLAIIGATQVLDDSLIPFWTATDHRGGLASAKNVDRLVAAVRAARPTSDTLVVFLHWGLEGSTCATQTQRDLAHRLVDAGADIVIGSHAHRVLGGGRLGHAFVDYGLGNFAFYSGAGPQSDTGVLLLTVTGRHVDRYEWQPAEIHGGLPRALAGRAAPAAVAQWQARRSCTDLTP